MNTKEIDIISGQPLTVIKDGDNANAIAFTVKDAHDEALHAREQGSSILADKIEAVIARWTEDQRRNLEPDSEVAEKIRHERAVEILHNESMLEVARMVVCISTGSWKDDKAVIFEKEKPGSNSLRGNFRVYGEDFPQARERILESLKVDPAKSEPSDIDPVWKLTLADSLTFEYTGSHIKSREAENSLQVKKFDVQALKGFHLLSVTSSLPLLAGTEVLVLARNKPQDLKLLH